MSKSFFAHGKLLLTGEYVVLDGALAIALPTRLGQRMQVEKIDDIHLLHWKGCDHLGQTWLQGIWNTQTQVWESVNDKDKALFLQKIFLYLQNNFGKIIAGYKITTHLEFPGEWGLGSSSTLIAIIAQWLEIDAFELLENSFGGSGYDVACASQTSPITFRIVDNQKMITPIQMQEDFKKRIAFVYMGKKQNSREGIAHYRSLSQNKSRAAHDVTRISKTILKTESFNEFEQLIQYHEDIISYLMYYDKVKNLYFSDYEGVVKSLGAWGGDFVLATHDGDFEKAKSYFNTKGYETVFRYEELVY
ncbi:MAG: GYDIA family GHMP kinase [Chitinophagales bacterium]|nr:GYDIA family GHMP kinase [Chitinophagales bacterium]